MKSLTHTGRDTGTHNDEVWDGRGITTVFCVWYCGWCVVLSASSLWGHPHAHWLEIIGRDLLQRYIYIYTCVLVERLYFLRSVKYLQIPDGTPFVNM